MEVSVVVCTYSMERLDAFYEAVDSILEQTYEPIEIVLVIDGNERVFERVRDRYGDHENVVLHCNDENQGISYSRTKGGEIASGDVVAFIDDDATAHPTWIEELVDVYDETDALAVGGRMAPDWVAGRPKFLPEEFYWLIGVTHRGFAEPGEEVRNTFGSNLSFKREVFLDLGGFDPNVGRKGEKEMQAHESEIGARLRRQYNQGVIYHPDAIVEHKVFDYRTQLTWLLNRAFMQGYSKRVLAKLAPDASGDKNEFLSQLLLEFVPDRLRKLVRNPSVEQASQLLMLFLLTGTVGLGYLYGIATVR
ncbi:glucosyl-dolichyl phosphate glucuronosyltransferase [Halopiger aswanensis]|uniref:Glycosyl transferase family 2 n=1 Tax=Halopiger aswanensis TaxID=148449 RepID=A0A3R7GLL1_9EURY|nr:glucosyl-dolichyl phosphate glucuronosyltransferase [Halopiger aswanensis]RKD98061.1 glycosyl transferase family 2 [Halopiger aswanensis]